MADWQGELDALLARLSVSLEPEDASTMIAPSYATMEPAEAPSLEGPEADPLWPSASFAAEEPKENVEVSAVRSEIEATLRQIVALARAGHIEASLRDDVIFVLHALTRPRPSAPALRLVTPPQGDDPRESAQEWQLASAAAVLRFCRIVSRLTNTLARDPEL